MSTAIFIDGGYLAKFTKNIGFGIDFAKLSDYLCGKSQLFKAYYYYCMPYQSPDPTPDESTRYSNADKFINNIKKIPNYEVKLGRLQRVYNQYTQKYEYNQKMVDVMLAVDLVKLSIERTITRAIIMAGDSDFVYAIHIAKQSGVDIELYYSNHINDDLFNAVTEPKLINQHLINKCRRY